jgi:hypothetical protein
MLHCNRCCSAMLQSSHGLHVKLASRQTLLLLLLLLLLL